MNLLNKITPITTNASTAKIINNVQYQVNIKYIEEETTEVTEEVVPETTEEYNVIIKDEERCPRYIGAKIEGLGVKPSPFEMQSRIWRVGMRPINALVDITNYVMLALGQPTHVFDADNISDKITVRRAGEKEELLLQKVYKN